jgi:hypothetical protein
MAYQEWKNKPNSKLWLNGKPGCGKTVLSSTIIEDLHETHQHVPLAAILFFYFRYDFKPAKVSDTQYGQMLRSLLVQLSYQSQTLPGELDGLYEKHLNGGRQPSNADMDTTIRDLLPKFEHVFIVLDALDECDETQSLLDFQNKLSHKPIPGLHFLATNRKYVIIQEYMTSYNQIQLEEAKITEDIAVFVNEQLASSDFNNFPQALKLEAVKRLTRDASGM